MSSACTPLEGAHDGSTVETVLAAEDVHKIQHVYQILQKEQAKKKAPGAPISPQRMAQHFLLLDSDTHEPRFSPAQITAALSIPESTDRELSRRDHKFSSWLVDATPATGTTTFANAPTIPEVLSTPGLPPAFSILIEDSLHGDYHIKVPITSAHMTVRQTLQVLQLRCGHGKFMYRDPALSERFLVTDDATPHGKSLLSR